MNPETAIDLFIAEMEERHWSTTTTDVAAARDQALRTAAQSLLWDLRKYARPAVPVPQGDDLQPQDQALRMGEDGEDG